MRLLFCLFFVLIFVRTQSQIVNAESQRMQSDTVGWMGDFGTDFSFIKNAVSIININFYAHVQYKTEKNVYLLFGNYNLLRGSGQTFSNNAFYHFRYDRKLNQWLRWEAFTQAQKNNVTGIRIRELVGTGPRFKIYGAPKFALYAGTAAMYEYEEEQTKPIVYHNDLRSSNYVSFTYKPNKILELISTTFYQPLYKQLNDFRVLNEISLTIAIYGHLALTTAWSYLYDAFPAANTPSINYSFSNGVKYTF